MRYTRHRMEAEDILQDAFIKIFDNLKQFKFQGSVEGWIRRIVVNTALKNFQKKGFTYEQWGLDNVHFDQSADPAIYGLLGHQELLDLIAGLPHGYRIVFNLFAVEGYSHREIAEMLDIQESTSRSQLIKARRMLQAQIQKRQRIAV